MYTTRLGIALPFVRSFSVSPCDVRLFRRNLVHWYGLAKRRTSLKMFRNWPFFQSLFTPRLILKSRYVNNCIKWSGVGLGLDFITIMLYSFLSLLCYQSEYENVLLCSNIALHCSFFSISCSNVDSFCICNLDKATLTYFDLEIAFKWLLKTLEINGQDITL